MGECAECGYVGSPEENKAGCPKCGGAWKYIELQGRGSGTGTVKQLVRKVMSSPSVPISFPHDFLLANVSIDDVPRVKLWSARFFVKQLSALWSIEVPVQFPNRLALVSLIDAIIGEVISARDALRKKLADDIQSNKLKPWKPEILAPLRKAMSDDNWLDRVLKLRNSGLHGTYLPENIRIGGSPPLDMRLVGYEKGIVADVSMPQDFDLVCRKLEELIQESYQLVEKSLEERNATKGQSGTLADWFTLLG